MPCFPEGTLVSTPSGLKAIESLGVNDYIWCFDHLTNTTKLDVVTGLSMNWTNCLMNIHFDNEIVKATANHPFWEEEEEYFRADFLTEGMKLRSSKGEILTVQKVEKEAVVVDTFNIEIRGSHNYFLVKRVFWYTTMMGFLNLRTQKRILLLFILLKM